MIAVQPQPEGVKSSSVTLSASPGSRAVDVDGPGDGIDFAEVELLDVVDG